MTDRVLIDTGPLVAFLSRPDAYHQACKDLFGRTRRPFVTCWPVLTETAYLLGHRPPALQALLQLPNEGLVQIAPLDEDAPAWIAAFLGRYGDLRPDLADAALVYLAEQHDIDTIFTLDRRDFSVYRRPNGRHFHLLPE